MYLKNTVKIRVRVAQTWWPEDQMRVSQAIAVPGNNPFPSSFSSSSSPWSLLHSPLQVWPSLMPTSLRSPAPATENRADAKEGKGFGTERLSNLWTELRRSALGASGV